MGGKKLYTALVAVQAPRVDFSHHVENWHRACRKGATFYVTRADSLFAALADPLHLAQLNMRVPIHWQRQANRCLVVATIATGFLVTLVATDRALANVPCAVGPREQDEVWLVSCRSMGCGDPAQQVDNLRYWHYDRAGGWQPSTVDELLATDDPDVITVVFLHGNRIPCDEAFTKGWSAYRAVVACADERPVRFVIWSWPSEPLRGPINDARVKAARTDPCGYYLAWLLDRMRPEVPVSCWAHSYGARIVTGALHLLGGGRLCGHHLAHRVHEQRDPMQVVFLAAALDSDWLLPGHYQDRAMSQVSSMLLVNNGCDALLRRYHLIYCRRSCQQALGYTGLATGYLAPGDQGKVSQVDACCYVGRRHLLALYIGAPDLMAQMRSYLLFDNDGPNDAATASTATEVAAAESEAELEIAVE